MKLLLFATKHKIPDDGFEPVADISQILCYLKMASAIRRVNAGEQHMKAYVVAQTEVFDRDGYQPYATGFEEIFYRHGGRFIVSSQSVTSVAEGKWDPPNTVIMEFPNRSAAEAWLSDPDYIELAKVRHRTARTNMVIVDTAPDEYLAASRSR